MFPVKRLIGAFRATYRVTNSRETGVKRARAEKEKRSIRRMSDRNDKERRPCTRGAPTRQRFSLKLSSDFDVPHSAVAGLIRSLALSSILEWFIRFAGVSRVKRRKEIEPDEMDGIRWFCWQHCVFLAISCIQAINTFANMTILIYIFSLTS